MFQKQEISEADLKARWNKKREHLEVLAKSIQRLRLNITKSLNDPDNEKDFLKALVIKTMLETGERIGNSASASEGRVGVTGFLKKHVKITGNICTFEYTGKSSVEHEKKVTDELLARSLKKAIKNSPDARVFTTSEGFQINGSMVNRWLDEFGVTAKDARGFSCNKWLVQKLRTIEPEETDKKRQKQFNKAARYVSQKVGHGLATYKKHYMLPEIETAFVDEGKIVELKQVYEKGGLVEVDDSFDILEYIGIW